MFNQKKVEIFLAKFHKSLAKQFLEVAINKKAKADTIKIFFTHNGFYMKINAYLCNLKQ